MIFGYRILREADLARLEEKWRGEGRADLLSSRGEYTRNQDHEIALAVLEERRKWTPAILEHDLNDFANKQRIDILERENEALTRLSAATEKELSFYRKEKTT